MRLRGHGQHLEPAAAQLDADVIAAEALQAEVVALGPIPLAWEEVSGISRWETRLGVPRSGWPGRDPGAWCRPQGFTAPSYHERPGGANSAGERRNGRAAQKNDPRRSGSAGVALNSASTYTDARGTIMILSGVSPSRKWNTSLERR
jgi:hypothetical protein